MDIFRLDDNSRPSVAALIARVCAGLPMNVTSELEKVDLNTLFASESCLLIRVRGESMLKTIADGDWILLDRAKHPRQGDIIVAQLGDGFTVKKFDNGRHGLRLAPANSDYPIREVTAADDFEIVGTVIYVFHPV